MLIYVRAQSVWDQYFDNATNNSLTVCTSMGPTSCNANPKQTPLELG